MKYSPSIINPIERQRIHNTQGLTWGGEAVAVLTSFPVSAEDGLL